jgi:hypothetical protein
VIQELEFFLHCLIKRFVLTTRVTPSRGDDSLPNRNVRDRFLLGGERQKNSFATWQEFGIMRNQEAKREEER